MRGNYVLHVPPLRDGGVLTGDGNSDEYCPHCDNHFVLEAMTPQAELRVEMEDPRLDNRFVSRDIWEMEGLG